jgi:hypothetical protein
MAKRGPAPGSGGGGKRPGAGRPRLQVSCGISADDLRTLRTLALAAGVSVEDKARVLLANAITEEWRRYDESITQAAESAWEGEIL